MKNFIEKIKQNKLRTTCIGLSAFLFGFIAVSVFNNIGDTYAVSTDSICPSGWVETDTAGKCCPSSYELYNPETDICVIKDVETEDACKSLGYFVYFGFDVCHVKGVVTTNAQYSWVFKPNATTSGTYGATWTSPGSGYYREGTVMITCSGSSCTNRITSLPSVSRAGYAFAGWSSDSSCSSRASFRTPMSITKSLTFYACWEKKDACYVCGNSQGGAYFWGKAAGSSSCTIQTQYTTKSACLANNPDNANSQIPSDFTITSSSVNSEEIPDTIQYYKITYDLDGGKLIDGKTSKTQYVAGNKAVGTPKTNPIKDGESFVGWQFDGKIFDFNTKLDDIKDKLSSITEKNVKIYTLTLKAVYTPLDYSEMSCDDGWVLDPSTKKCYQVLKNTDSYPTYTTTTYSANSKYCWAYNNSQNKPGARAIHSIYEADCPASGIVRTSTTSGAKGLCKVYGKNNATTGEYKNYSNSESWMSENTCFVGSECTSAITSSDSCSIKWNAIIYNVKSATITKKTYATGETYGGTTSCTVNYYWNNGEKGYFSNSVSGTTKSQTCTYGKTCTLNKSGYSSTGYNFAGWNINRDGSGASYSDGDKTAYICQHADENNKVSLYAQWEPVTCKVNFYWNNDVLGNKVTGSNQSVECIYGKTCTLTKNNYISTGYNFTGWNTEKQGTGTSYSDGNKTAYICKYANSSNKVNLYAQWEPMTCNVHFYWNNNILGNKVTGSNDSVKCTYGTDCTLTKNNYKSTGYSFNGWNTDREGNGTPYSDGYTSSVICKYANSYNNVKLYAQWKANKVNIKLNTAGGTFNQISTSTKYSKDSNDNLVYNKTREYIHSINYGEKLANSGNGLINYNSTTNGFTITKEGYHAVDGAEWKCLSGNCKKETYDQDETYAASDFCDASNGDCEVVLGVNWEKNQVKIQFNVNGGTFNEKSTSTKYSKDSNGYLVYTNDDGTTTKNIHSVVYNETLYNKGYGLINYNSGTTNGFTITREGYHVDAGAEWICLSGDCKKGQTYDQDNKTYKATSFCSESTNRDCEVVLGVNWEADIIEVELNNQNATSAGTKNIYYRYNTTTKINDTNCYYYSDINLQKCLDNGYSITKPTRTGYTFKGYYTEENGGGTQYVNANGSFINNIYKNVTEKITLYANWEANTYTIKFNSNGGFGIMYSMNIAYDKSENLIENNYKKAGYSFKGWNTKKDGSGTTYNDNDSVENLTSTNGEIVTLYAQWETNSYTIQYDANGGTGTTMNNSTCTYGLRCTLNANEYTNEGYTFIGWNTDSEGNGKFYLENSNVNILTSEKTITLYAQWVSNEDSIEFKDLEINNNIIIVSPGTLLKTINNNIVMQDSDGKSITDINNKDIDIINNPETNAKTGDKFKIKPKSLTLTISVKGDTDGNGVIDKYDIDKIANYITNNKELSEEFRLASDVDNNDNINVMDIIKIAKYINNKGNL